MRAFILGMALAATLGGCATTSRPSANAAQELIEIEAEFARQADEIGIVPAFRQFVGPDAILFLPDPTVINPLLETASWPGDLDWRPELVVVSTAGDLALTSGPSVWRVGANADLGVYFSIWKRQPDASWKFAIDGNTPMAQNLFALPPSLPETLLGVASDTDPSATIQELEGALAADAARDAPRAIASRLSPRGRVMRANLAPGIGPEAAIPLLALQGSTMSLRFIDGGMAASSDLAYGYGESNWTEGGSPRRGYWVRVWRRESGAWRIIFDQLNPRPET